MTGKIVISLTLLIAALPWLQAKEKEAPAWVTEVATRNIPAYSGKVPAAVLLDSVKVTVDASGTMSTVTHHALKILTHEGKRSAEVMVPYEKGGRQVKELHAWLVAPGGFVKTFEKNSVEDLGVYSDELYNDYRLRRIKADNPELGAVFVYESEVVEKLTEAQDRFMFQYDLPVVESRYSITAPPGWNVSGLILNHDAVAPLVDGNTYTWLLKDLPFREREEDSPTWGGNSPVLAVDFHPPSGAGPADFKGWPDVSRWHTAIAAPQADITSEMQAKVRELTANQLSEYGKIQVLSHYVQQFRYVEIAMDLAHYGGVRPHPASEVFSKQYGDCKDKANLLRALLRAAGIDSYLVAIFSGDRNYVKKDWPSPSQFNHMILAVKVTEAAPGLPVLDTALGKLLIFDPTDDMTPLGDLPFYEQGSYALICAGEKGDLMQMPVMPSSNSRTNQVVHASLTPIGNLTASLELDLHGQAARNARRENAASPARYKGNLERYLTYYAKQATVPSLETHDDFAAGSFSAKLNFESSGYGQLMQGNLLVFSAAVLRAPAPEFPVLKKRLEPIVLNGRTYHKQVFLKLPDGFKIDEMPSPYASETPFAKFQVTYRQEAGQLIMDEELRTEAVTLPPSDYPKVKEFFDQVLGADFQKAVMVKN